MNPIPRYQQGHETVPNTPCEEWSGGRSGGYGKRQRKEFRTQRVHRQVMAEAHGEDALDGLEVIHLCDNPPCGRYDHLRVGSHADNMFDQGAKGRGRYLSGDDAPWSKLTDAQVAEIRTRYKGPQHIGRRTGPTQAELADEFDVSQSQVTFIVRGKQRSVGFLATEVQVAVAILREIAIDESATEADRHLACDVLLEFGLKLAA